MCDSAAHVSAALICAIKSICATGAAYTVDRRWSVQIFNWEDEKVNKYFVSRRAVSLWARTGRQPIVRLIV